MLLWLWRRVHRKYIFLSKLLLISFGVHGLLLFVSLFIYHPTEFTHTIDLTSKPLHVVVLPFCKSAGQHSMVVSAHTSSQAQIQHDEVSLKRTSKTTIATGGSKNSKLAQKAAQKKKEKQKTKQEPVKKKEPEKPILAKKEPESAKETVVEQKPQSYNPEVPVTENVMYAGQQELDALELNETIRSSLEQTWQPPVGLSGGRCCKVSVLIDWDGKIKDMKVIESSQVLAFDMSVRNALLNMQFPKGAYGKELILPFR